MSAGRGDPNTPGNRPLFLSAGVPNLGCHNLAAPVAAGNTGSIASQVLFSPCSTSVLNTIQEVSAPQSAQLSPISRATEQDDVPCIQPSWNMPRGCTQVPINIIVFHRQLTGRGSRAQLPPSATTALPDVSEGKHVLILLFFLGVMLVQFSVAVLSYIMNALNALCLLLFYIFRRSFHSACWE
jgi:hypothetical protein